MSKDSGPFKANILLAIKVTVKLLQEGRYIIIENYGASYFVSRRIEKSMSGMRQTWSGHFQ